MRSDREIVLAAVAKDGRILEHASDELRGDREIVMRAISQNGLSARNHFSLNFCHCFGCGSDVVRTWFGCGSDVVRMCFGRGS